MDMIVHTQNRASLTASALDPASIKVDGRDNRDRLAFVSSYSQLIQYYNHDNQVDGNWQSFFMKDPSILLAHISKTDYERYLARFMLLDRGIRLSSTNDSAFVFIDQLCHLLRDMFSTLNQWMRFMELNAGVHHLHLFLEKKIRGNLSGHLSLLIVLQQRLNRVTQQGVSEPDMMFYRNFESLWYERPINLTALAASSNGSIQPLLTALRRIYHIVFNVLTQAVEYATQAFYEMEDEPTKYPDTALMIVFSRLMELQQDEINKLGRKHLDFYYERILRQSMRPATPDQVFVNLKLAGEVSSFSLPAGTLFRAGSYPDQSEILFCNESNEEINQAAISSVYTLYCDQSAAGTATLYLNSITAPDQVARNLSQEIVTWDGFGNSSGIPIQQGFALASPMFLLQAGLRTITIEFTLDGNSLPSLTDSQCYLSTVAGWFQVIPDKSSSANKIVIVLQPSDPAIVAFKTGPDGFTSVWPMFKMMLGTSADLFAPPSLTQVSITVEVDNFSQFSMANDVSPLPNTGPQQIFGPIPESGSRFYVGSNECFAKPLRSLTLTMNWDNLPADFSDYYLAYNRYLAPKPPSTSTDPTGPFNNLAFAGQWHLLNKKDWKVLHVTVTARPLPSSSSSSGDTQDAALGNPLNPNKIMQALKTAFLSLKKMFQWISGLIASPLLPVGTSLPAAAGSPTGSPPDANDDVVALFQQYKPSSSSGNKLYPNSIFKFEFGNGNIYMPQPALALSALPPVNQANSGYMQFDLEKPDYAFGNSLYAQVVAQTSLDNAQFLMQQAKGKSILSLISGIAKFIKKPLASLTDASRKTDTPTALEALPNMPYIPKQSLLTGSYSATAVTSVTANVPEDVNPSIYPLQLYHYGAFKPYLAYDTVSTGRNLGFVNLTPKGSDSRKYSSQKLPLFTGVSGQGCLYASLRGVRAPCTLTLYAEISADENQAAPDDGDVGYYCWTNTGWQPITVLYNDTGNLTRSGLIKFDIQAAIPPETPADLLMTSMQKVEIEQAALRQSYVSSPIMPNTDFWLAIATKANGINIKLSYLNTQTIKLTRFSMASLPLGETPQIAADTISSTKDKIAQIASIVQPFPSFGGMPAEDKSSYGGFNSFYRRVSSRLNNKDRVVNSADFAAMSHEACSGLYCARVLPNSRGVVRVGLVNGYANAQLPNAFRPIVGGMEQDKIVKHIAHRVSSQARLSVSNLKHRVVTVSATFLIASDSDVGAMKSEINQALKVYLSPWISSDMPQASLGRSINQSALISFLTAQKGVISVKNLDFVGGEMLDDDETIFVSALEHDLKFAEVEHV